MDTSINISRLDDLILGNDKPADLSEEMFLAAYMAALAGELLLTFLLNNREVLDEMTKDETWLMVFGYGRGQNEIEENDQHFFVQGAGSKKKMH